MSKFPLNKAQQEAVDYIDGPLLIVAGAGTGKTRVVTEKIAKLINDEKAKPEEILAITFTDKAAAEMEERVDEQLALGYVDIQISTFHAFCQRILEEHAIDIGLSNQFRLLTETESWLLFREHLKDFDLDYYRPLGNPSKHIHELLKHFSKCKDELISPEEYLEYAEGIQLDTGSVEIEERNRIIELGKCYHQYNQLLLDNACLDFADLIYYTVKLLEKRPKIKEKLQKRFKFILVDEFQDVNWSQYKLVSLLAENSQLTVVGDDDQSIYSFRGASVSNIMQFKEDYKGAKEIVLNENYRSKQQILDASYTLVQNNNPDRLEAKLNIDKKLIAQGYEEDKKETPVEHKHFASLEDEIRWVVEQIAETKEKNSELSWDDFAILIRANNAASPFMEALAAACIPYEFLAASGLYKQPIVIDAINFFSAIENKNNSTAYFRLMQLPFLALSQSDEQKIVYYAKKKSISYYEALKRAREYFVSEEGVKICEQIISLVHEGMKQKRTEKPTRMLLNFMESSGYFAYIAREEEQGNPEVIRQIYQLKQFFTVLEKYEQTVADAHVMNFLDHYYNVVDAGDSGALYQVNDTPDSVNILTVHSSKGLEYKYVFIVNAVEGRFPTQRRGKGIEVPEALIKEHLPEGDIHYQEERRLFYVAMTRAKEKLFLTSADNYGGVRKKKISRFVFESNQEKETIVEVEKGEGLLADFQFKKIKVQEKGELVYDIPKAFSFSQISLYQRCPYQYKLSYILNIPKKGNPALSFGNSIHNTLHEFYKKVQEFNSAKQDSLFGGMFEEVKAAEQSNIKVPSVDDLLALYDEKWIDDWYANKAQREDYYKKGKKILKKFYEDNIGKWTVPVALESWFKMRIGDFFVQGRIDRIDQDDEGALHIIDYKTGKTKEKLSTGDKDQLLIYQMVCSKLPEYRNLGATNKLTFHYLEDNVETDFIGKEKDLARIEEKTLKTLHDIKDKKFDATPNKMVCKYCDFKSICGYRDI